MMKGQHSIRVDNVGVTSMERLSRLSKYNRLKNSPQGITRNEEKRDRKRTEKERKEFPELDSKRFGNSNSFIAPQTPEYRTLL
jgi:hypothetical protein